MSVITNINWLKYRRTKIVATVGPASQHPDKLRQLILAGVNVFRLNFSHGDHKSHGEVYHLIRAAAEELNLPVAVLADLCGPKIRAGRFEGGAVLLVAGEQVTVTTKDVIGGPGLIPSQYESLAEDVRPGDRILLDDGGLTLEVSSVEGSDVSCLVIHGGLLKDHKGINLPGVKVSAPSLTPKDKIDAGFALSLGADFIALSFVRTADDINALKDIVDDAENSAEIIAKIEKPEALDNAEEILEVTDGIMVARGDLGVELPPEEVPLAQRGLIDLARRFNKPVIVATQMLESMISSPRPTRAEVTDVSHAVDACADAVMLSGETAAGEYPVEAVAMMDRVARQTEAHMWKQGAYGLSGVDDDKPLPMWRAMANATSTMSRDLDARGIVVISQSGRSAYSVSSARPAAPVVVVTHDQKLARQINLLWGVIPVVSEEIGQANPNQVATQIARDLDLGDPGQHVLMVRGFNDDPEMNTPSVTILTL